MAGSKLPISLRPPPAVILPGGIDVLHAPPILLTQSVSSLRAGTMAREPHLSESWLWRRAGKRKRERPDHLRPRKVVGPKYYRPFLTDFAFV